MTALHIVTATGPDKPPATRVLLDARANPDARDLQAGGTPLIFAANNPDAEPELVRARCSRSARPASTTARGPSRGLRASCSRSHGSAPDWAPRARSSASPAKGCTVLHHAAREGNVELCCELIAGGADPTLRNAMGMTPLRLAEWWLDSTDRSGRKARAARGGTPSLTTEASVVSNGGSAHLVSDPCQYVL